MAVYVVVNDDNQVVAAMRDGKKAKIIADACDGTVTQICLDDDPLKLYAKRADL